MNKICLLENTEGPLPQPGRFTSTLHTTVEGRYESGQNVAITVYCENQCLVALEAVNKVRYEWFVVGIYHGIYR